MGFEPPPVYEFPPLYTKQLNEQTWTAQRKHWEAIILNWSRSTRIWRVDPDAAVFENSRVQRKLPSDVAHQVLEYMVERGTAEWAPGSMSIALVYIQTPDVVATRLRQWAQETGNNGTILTTYELCQGELAGLEDFEGMDTHILRKAIDILVKAGDAAAIKEDGETQGVKLG